MSYTTITQSTRDEALRDRVVAGAMKEAVAGAAEFADSEFAASLKLTPALALTYFLWPTAIDYETEYAYAVDSANPNPGGDVGVITDANIQAVVQLNWPRRGPAASRGRCMSRHRPRSELLEEREWRKCCPHDQGPGASCSKRSSTSVAPTSTSSTPSTGASSFDLFESPGAVGRPVDPQPLQPDAEGPPARVLHARQRLRLLAHLLLPRPCRHHASAAPSATPSSCWPKRSTPTVPARVDEVPRPADEHDADQDRVRQRELHRVAALDDRPGSW